MADWYYADRNGQQQGPVDAAWLAGAAQRGEINAGTLVWRDGMRDWVPASQAGAELGIAFAAAPPPLASVMPPRVVAAKSGGSNTWVIVLVVLLVGFLFVGGIVAAIAIPAYHDYTVRAKLGQAINEGRALRLAVGDFYEREQRCPGNGDDGFKPAADYGSQYVESIEVGELESGQCAIRVTLRGVGNSAVDGRAVTFAMSADGEWSHDTDLPQKYLPASMRAGTQ